MPIIPAVIVSIIATASQSQKPAPTLGEVRSFYMAAHQESSGSEGKVANCFIEKMKKRGPFTFPDDKTKADALITLESTIPNGAKRVILGMSAKVRAVITTLDGFVLWSDDNTYKKSTAIWGGFTDIECGLANGLVNKLVKAIEKASRK